MLLVVGPFLFQFLEIGLQIHDQNDVVLNVNGFNIEMLCTRNVCALCIESDANAFAKVNTVVSPVVTVRVELENGRANTNCWLLYLHWQQYTRSNDNNSTC